MVSLLISLSCRLTRGGHPTNCSLFVGFGLKAVCYSFQKFAVKPTSVLVLDPPKNNYVSYFMGHKIKAGFSLRLLIGIISIIMKIQFFLHSLGLTKMVYNLVILS